jgi:hypothetical protein
MAVRAEDGIALQVPDSGAILCGWRAFGDGPLSGESASTIILPVALPTLLARPAEVPVQGSAPSSILPDVVVDRLVADGELASAPQPTRDLLGAEVLGEPG